jgi:hypothetical protein
MGTYGEPFPIKFLKEHIIDKLNYPFIWFFMILSKY